MKKKFRFTITVLAALAVWLLAFAAAIRPSFLRWGATDEEAARVLPGDERNLVSGYPCTRAITIEAPPDMVWPWFEQLGIGRAGFYSYSWLENLFLAGIHNTEVLVPEWKGRIAGDFVRSFQFGPDKSGMNGWRFDVLEPGRIFYLDPGWGPFVLEPRGASPTRLLVRSRGNPPNAVAKTLMGLLFDPIHFTMEKRMMIEVKRLAEGRPDGLRWLSALSTAGFLLAAVIAAGFIATRPRKKLWVLLPAAYALLILVGAKDLKSALVGFTASAILVAGFRMLGRRGWAVIFGFWVYADLVLIYAHDAYLIFGLVFLAAGLVFIQLRLAHRKGMHRMEAATSARQL